MSILKNVSCDRDKNICSAVVGCSSMQMSIISNRLTDATEFNRILNGFLPDGSVQFLQMSAETSSCNSGFIYFSLLFDIDCCLT